MAPSRDHRVLIPIDILGGESIPQTVVGAFASMPIVLLGYREIPDQTATDQARDQYEERARAELAELERVFEEAGCLDVTSRLVFTHDRLQTFERIAVEAECDAVLLSNPAPILETVLVAVRGDVNLEYIARFLGTLLTDTKLTVSFFHVVSDETDRGRGTELLETAADELVDAGVDRDRIDTELVVGGSPTGEILDAASDHDLLVVGESRPSVRRFIFRDRAEKLARETIDPVLVIRGEYLAADEAEDADDGGSGNSDGEEGNSDGDD